MGDTAGLNDATTYDVILGLVFGVSAVFLIVIAYVLYTKRFRKQKMIAIDEINFITAKYNIYIEKAQLLIEAPRQLKVRLALLDKDESLVDLLFDGELNVGEHIIDFDPKKYENGQYYFKLDSEGTNILKKIKIKS